MTQVLRLVSWNIQHLARGYSDFDGIVRVLTGLKPDVVLLQECDFGTFRSGGANQAKCIATAMRMNEISASAMRFDGGFYGIATLTKHAVSTAMTIPVPWTPHTKEARILAAVIGPLLPGIANVHLSHEPPGAARNELFRILPQLPAWVQILIGDFNHPPDGDLPAPWLEKSPATNGGYMPTWPSWSPSAALDRIIVKDGTAPIKAHIIAEPITDHLPLYAELES